jgi:MYXO-CTERM domain-containing protein
MTRTPTWFGFGVGRVAMRYALALFLVACSSSESEQAVERSSSAIVSGEASPASENAVVLVRNPRGDCTGTLVAPNLIATARHCVSSANLAMQCNERGETLSGGQSGTDYDPGRIAIYVGESLARGGSLTPTALGKRIVHDGSPTLCDHDLAFVVLAESVSAPVAKVRVASPAVEGETFRAVGWGLSVDKTSPTTRVSRGGVKVTVVGASKARLTGPHEIGATEAVCDGDSGGPALAESDGALLGVVTRGGSVRAAKLEPPEACKGDDILNVYTSLSAHAKTVQAAFAAAGQPVPEGPPEDPCAAAKCASGSTCRVVSGAARCEPVEPSTTPSDTGGCATSATSPRTGAFTLAMVGVVLAVARRKRRAST